MQDKIEREISIKAPKEQVYQAITDPTQIIKWFPDAVDGTIAKEEQPIFSFGEHGKTQVYIVDMQPHEYFAYRWVPGSHHFVGDLLQTETTLVEFKITETNGISTITMTESGFSKIPAKIAEAAYAQNNGGWDYMIGRLEKQFAKD